MITEISSPLCVNRAIRQVATQWWSHTICGAVHRQACDLVIISQKAVRSEQMWNRCKQAKVSPLRWSICTVRGSVMIRKKSVWSNRRWDSCKQAELFPRPDQVEALLRSDRKLLYLHKLEICVIRSGGTYCNQTEKFVRQNRAVIQSWQNANEFRLTVTQLWSKVT